MDPQLILVIGLPACGKTMYCSKLHGYRIYDDFVDSFVGSNLIADLRNGIKVVASDPRLCSPKLFNYYYRIFSNCTDPASIRIVIFASDLDQSIVNSKQRPDDGIKTADRIAVSIRALASIYDPTNYRIAPQTQIVHLPTYVPSVTSDD